MASLYKVGPRVETQKTLKYKNGELDITTDDELFGSDGATTMRHN